MLLLKINKRNLTLKKVLRLFSPWLSKSHNNLSSAMFSLFFLLFSQNARQCQFSGASHIDHAIISAFPRPCFIAPWTNHWYTAEKEKTNDTKVIKDQTYCIFNQLNNNFKRFVSCQQYNFTWLSKAINRQNTAVQ